MKRKLISYEIFESMNRQSLSNSEKELVEAAPLLAKALDLDELELLNFGAESAMYESVDGTYVHTNYRIEKDKLAFENIEQLAIDQDTEKDKSRETLSLLVDALLDNKDEAADHHFESYMKLPITRRSLREGIEDLKNFKFKKKGKKAKGSKSDKDLDAKGEAKEKFGKKKLPFKGAKPFGKKAGKKLDEWQSVANNTFNYIDYKELGPVVKESKIVREGRDVVAVKFPLSEGRTMANMLRFDWKVLDTELKVMRAKAKTVSEEVEFSKAVNELRRHNAMSDNSALEETLEKIVGQWPNLIYLTQDELADQIKVALEAVNASNYDDNTCVFMAEGILRAAHGVYNDKVSRVVKLSGAKVNEESKDQYTEFKGLADAFYPTLDESAVKEMQMYVDLYDALREVFGMAHEAGDPIVKTETATHLNELSAIINGQVKPDLDVAHEAAGWLDYVTEAALQSWNVTSDAYMTINGDHPQMGKNAVVRAMIPADYNSPNDFGADVYDGNGPSASAKADSMSAWTSAGSTDGTWPGLNNPYIPKPFGDYTMLGAVGVDKDGDTTLDPHNDDTWPSLKNPYIPKETPDLWRMKGADDLVVDK